MVRQHASSILLISVFQYFYPVIFMVARSTDFTDSLLPAGLPAWAAALPVLF